MARDEVETLRRLVGWPTISSNPLTELAAYVAQRCEDVGFKVERFEDQDSPGKVNVVCAAGPAGTDGLILSGHMDVVPVAGQAWSVDPFTLTERDGRLLGRGTSDMKGFIAASIEALGRLDLSRLQRELVLIWTHDEEVGCVGSAKLASRLAAEGRALPSEALIGEPTDFRILRMHPGHVALTITTFGEAAHSSKPDLGASAIKAMGRVITMLEQLEAELMRSRRFEDLLERPWVTMNMGTLHGGQAVNIVPDHCALMVGYRPLPGDDALAVFRVIEARARALKLPDSTRVEVHLERQTPSMLSPEGTPLQGLLTPHACCAETAAASFATDGGNLQALGVRSLIFGPGSIDVAHKADEYVRADALAQAVDVIEAVVRARCA
ncbi:MAG: acetylornithine deacetylase [Alphaproteobacteria bacterium]|nr:acetylornithine deacetylase [Alphaproteobacteria bacterium]